MSISRRLLLALSSLNLLGPLARPAKAARGTADVMLILAVDCSGSVTQQRYALQRQGYADAFRDARVQHAIMNLPGPSLHVAMFQWTGPDQQVVVIDWVIIDSYRDCQWLAEEIEAVPRQLHSGGTSISGAIEKAHAMLMEHQLPGARLVIDVSGDGANNRGARPEPSRDAAVADGITINGLPILFVEDGLEAHYRNSVIGGAGAFVIPVENDAQFADAIIRKLVAEIAGKSPASSPLLAQTLRG